MLMLLLIGFFLGLFMLLSLLFKDFSENIFGEIIFKILMILVVFIILFFIFLGRIITVIPYTVIYHLAMPLCLLNSGLLLVIGKLIKPIVEKSAYKALIKKFNNEQFCSEKAANDSFVVYTICNIIIIINFFISFIIMMVIGSVDPSII